MEIQKPTDDELKNQINGGMRNQKFLRYFGLIVGVIYIIFVNRTLGFIIAVSGFVLANQHIISSKQDKIRLEIRETPVKDFKKHRSPFRKARKN